MSNFTTLSYPQIREPLSGDKYNLKSEFNSRISVINDNLMLYFDEDSARLFLSKIWYKMSGDLMQWKGKRGGDIIIANSGYQSTREVICRVNPFSDCYPLSQGNFNEIQRDIVATFLPRRISGPTCYDDSLFKENREKICKRHNIGFFKYYKEKMLADREVRRIIKVEKKKRLEYKK